jgi:hypothetical protein
MKEGGGSIVVLGYTYGGGGGYGSVRRNKGIRRRIRLLLLL